MKLQAAIVLLAVGCKASHGGGLSEAPGAHATHDIYHEQEAWSGACNGGVDGTSPKQRQSPIALDPQAFAKVKTSGITLRYGEEGARLIDNGHTVQVAFADPKQTLSFEGREYLLRQFHFHRMSEHVVVGQQPVAERRYGMEVHFVHTRTPDGPDDQAVAGALGFFVQEGPENAALERVWSGVPDDLDKDEVLPVDAADMIPRGAQYMVYQGSLTTPPCDEYVTHAVSTTPMTMSAAQMDRFAKLYPRNNRRLQPIGDTGIRRFRMTTETTP